jgi:hypothetical protein
MALAVVLMFKPILPPHHQSFYLALRQPPGPQHFRCTDFHFLKMMRGLAVPMTTCPLTDPK